MILVSVKTFANQHNLAISTVRQMCKYNVLPSLKIGVGWRIDLDRAEQVLAAKINARQTPDEPKAAPKPSIIYRRKPKKADDFLARLKAL